MKEKLKNKILNFLGGFFIFISLGSTINSYFLFGISELFWMCYVSSFLIGLGILLRKSNIVLAQIYILAIAVLIWNIDFFYQLITSSSLWGITDYFFTRDFNLGKFFSLQHIYSIPLAIYSIHLLGTKFKNSIKISLAQIVIIYFATLVITNSSVNANCIYYPCFNLGFEIPFYPVFWFLGYLIMIFIAYFFTKFLMKFKNINLYF